MSDAAKLLDTTEERIYAWVDEGSIPFYEVSEQYRFNRAELLEWATARGVRVSVEIFQRAASTAVSLVDALEAGGVHGDLRVGDRAELVRALVALLPIQDPADRALVGDVLLARSAQDTTVGDGIVIPQVRSPIVLHGTRPSLTLALLAEPLPGDREGPRVEAVFTLVSPTPKAHLDLLSRLTAALHDPGFRRAVVAREGSAALLREAARVEASFGGAEGRSATP